MKIGITGHQRLADPTAWEWVRLNLHDYLEKQERPLIGLSSLAAGADQCFAETVLEVGGSVEVIVPFDGYESKFASDAERSKYRELLARAVGVSVLPKPVSDEDGYFRAGKRIVDESDYIVAVWNGQPAKGLGGTADVVQYAASLGKPIHHLEPESRMVLSHEGEVLTAHGAIHFPNVTVSDISRSTDPAIFERLSIASTRGEHDLVELLARVLRLSTGGHMWIQTEVNLWDRIPKGQWPERVLESTGHVWQPDIDLAYGPKTDGKKGTPVHAVEVKYFATSTGAAQIIPKTKIGTRWTGGGFHEGLGQALVLLLDGVDYVSLWHIFHLPYDTWVDYGARFSEGFSDRIQDAYTDFCAAYAGKITGLIRALDLPIGYQCIGLITAKDLPLEHLSLRLIPVPKVSVNPPINRLRDKRDPWRARQQLLEALGVELG